MSHSLNIDDGFGSNHSSSRSRLSQSYCSCSDAGSRVDHYDAQNHEDRSVRCKTSISLLPAFDDVADSNVPSTSCNDNEKTADKNQSCCGNCVILSNLAENGRCSAVNDSAVRDVSRSQSQCSCGKVASPASLCSTAHCRNTTSYTESMSDCVTPGEIMANRRSNGASTLTTVRMPTQTDDQCNEMCNENVEQRINSSSLCSIVYSYISSSFLFSLTRHEKSVLLCLAVVDLTSQMCLSIMAPFFPTEAANKGVSNTISGWIFGVFALIQFITSPIFGKVLPHFGSRFLITAGQFFSGGCVVLFGFIIDMEDDDGPELFIAFCFILRIFLAVGCTASATASFAVTANVFPNNVGTIFGLLETATGLGLMVGPAMGGLLYQVGGFRLPFVVLGGLMLLTVPANYFLLPERDEESQPNIQSVSLLQILRIPAIGVVCLCVIVAALMWSIIDPTLAPHLQQFDIGPAVLGLLFLLMSAFYAVFSPIWGWIADKLNDSSPMLVIGFFGSALGMLLLGPSPWLGITDSDSMWLNICSLVLLGISVGLALVPTFDKILDAVEKADINDSFAMYSIVSGIWGSCYALGDFLGPSLGGWLVDKYGFPLCVSYIAVICAFTGIVVLVMWLWEKFCGRHASSNGSCIKPSNEVTSLDDDILETYNEQTSLLTPPHRTSELA